MAAPSKPAAPAKPEPDTGALGAASPPVRAAGGTPAHVAAAPARPASVGTPAHGVAVPATATMRNCPSCGNQVPFEFVFCGQCGTRLGVEPAPAAPAPAAAAPSTPAKAPSSGPLPRGKLVLIKPDGNEGGFITISDGETVVGRSAGPLFETDSYLSPRHAIFTLSGNKLLVRDADSLNGVYVKMTGEEEIIDGEVFRMGQELLRFEAVTTPEPLPDGTEVMGSPNPGYWGRVAVIVGRNQDGAAFPLSGDSATVGRERGDILFPEDGYVSGSHARLVHRDGRFFLVDLNSSNGSFLRLRGERAITSGSFLLMGQQLFRIQYA